MCCDVACGDKVLDCRVVDEVDLTMDASMAAVNSMMLNDPSCQNTFSKRTLWRFMKESETSARCG